MSMFRPQYRVRSCCAGTHRFGRIAGVALLFAAAGTLLSSCGEPADPGAAAAGEAGWLTGSTHEKFDVVSDHLGGFGVAMWQIGYRYTELYWAGEDRNWAYALHQLEEMEEVMEQALVRRPERAASAEPFLRAVIPDVQQAAEAQDYAAFSAAFQSMITYCNACHVLEDHAYIQVWKPEVRMFPWGMRRE